MASADEISVDAAVAAVLLQVDFARQVQSKAARALLWEEMFSAFLQTSFGG